MTPGQLAAIDQQHDAEYLFEGWTWHDLGLLMAVLFLIVLWAGYTDWRSLR